MLRRAWSTTLATSILCSWWRDRRQGGRRVEPADVDSNCRQIKHQAVIAAIPVGVRRYRSACTAPYKVLPHAYYEARADRGNREGLRRGPAGELRLR